MQNKLHNLLTNLTINSSDDTAREILSQYDKKGYSIVHFLYFATIILNHLDTNNPPSEKEREFTRALLSGDFLLPDGIALRLLYKKIFKKDLPNLNGTDFLPLFLSSLPKNRNVEVFLYGATEEAVTKAAAHIRATFGHRVHTPQNGFQAFDWSSMPPKEIGTIRILLVGRGSPLQELWAENNRELIQSHQCLVFSVG
jgi:exopolysaccharide biosynthesis WecB/TagA/CpsF family protein